MNDSIYTSEERAYREIAKTAKNSILTKVQEDKLYSISEKLRKVGLPCTIISPSNIVIPCRINSSMYPIHTLYESVEHFDDNSEFGRICNLLESIMKLDGSYAINLTFLNNHVYFQIGYGKA